jgi:uncharacterized protein YlxP (DUF503 family)
MPKNDKLTMYIGTCLLTIEIPEAASLKDKRSVVKSLVERARRELRISAAEVGMLDEWQTAQVGLACVSNSAATADRVIAEAVNWVEKNLQDGNLEDYQTEILRAF